MLNNNSDNKIKHESFQLKNPHLDVYNGFEVDLVEATPKLQGRRLTQVPPPVAHQQLSPINQNN